MEFDFEKDDEDVRFPFFHNISRLYDKRTMLLIGLNFFNEGAEFMTTLAATIQYFEYWEN